MVMINSSGSATELIMMGLCLFTRPMMAIVDYLISKFLETCLTYSVIHDITFLAQIQSEGAFKRTKH